MMVESRIPKDHAAHGTYRAGMSCPGCGLSNWHIGTISAECGRCGCALELPHSQRPGGRVTFKTGKIS